MTSANTHIPTRRLPAAIAAVLLAVSAGCLLHSCFTGVESTPRITASDVKRENISVSAEEKYLADIRPEAPADWRQGKTFRVTDNKIAYVLTGARTDSLKGRDLVFGGFRKNTDVTGAERAEALFTTADGTAYAYRTETPWSDLDGRARLDIPFTVDLDLVDRVASRMTGQRYYVVTPLWYDSEGGASVQGLRHVPVRVTAVEPGNDVYPVRVLFERDDAPGTLYSMYMTLGTGRTSTRNFDKLFALDNPRTRYPRITDETWDMITHSRVKEGMTRDECRLALGSPVTIGQRPTTAGMVEYWQYADGIYLIFEENFLTAYRK